MKEKDRKQKTISIFYKRFDKQFDNIKLTQKQEPNLLSNISYPPNALPASYCQPPILHQQVFRLVKQGQLSCCLKLKA